VVLLSVVGEEMGWGERQELLSCMPAHLPTEERGRDVQLNKPTEILRSQLA
jgi:hypothetical protein